MVYSYVLAILPFALFQLASTLKSTAHNVTTGANAQLVFSQNIVNAARGSWR